MEKELFKKKKKSVDRLPIMFTFLAELKHDHILMSRKHNSGLNGLSIVPNLGYYATHDKQFNYANKHCALTTLSDLFFLLLLISCLEC